MPAPEERPKYSLLEIERRWLVDLARVGSLVGLPFRRLEDAYRPGPRRSARPQPRSNRASKPGGHASRYASVSTPSSSRGSTTPSRYIPSQPR